MTIGGNDSGVFINSIVQCGVAGAATAGTGSPCKDQYGSSFEDTIRTTTYPALVKSLRAVRAEAPNARVAILGYPWIVPPGRLLPADAGRPRRRALPPQPAATLNRRRRAAAATGSTYVDLTRSPRATTPASRSASAGSSRSSAPPTR